MGWTYQYGEGTWQLGSKWSSQPWIGLNWTLYVQILVICSYPPHPTNIGSRQEGDRRWERERERRQRCDKPIISEHACYHLYLQARRHPFWSYKQLSAATAQNPSPSTIHRILKLFGLGKRRSKQKILIKPPLARKRLRFARKSRREKLPIVDLLGRVLGAANLELWTTIVAEITWPKGPLPWIDWA